MKRLFLMLSVLCFVTCGNDSTDNPASEPKDPIVIPDQPTPPVFSEQGGSSTYRFSAKTAWTADVAATRATNWCSVSPTSGGKGDVTLSIITQPNDTPDERNATITLRAGEASKTFAITQKQKDALTLTSSKIELEAAGGTATVEVRANISFEYEIGADAAEWVTYTGTRALQTSRLEFNVAENDDTAVREGTITIRSSEGEETVKIYQEGAAPALVLTQKDYTVASDGETIKVEIKSNVDYSVTMPQAGWVTESSSRAMSTHTRYFVVAPNEDYDARSAEIIFTNKANNLTQKVSITQLQKDALVVAQNSYTLTNAGGEITIAVNHNVNFDVAIDQQWVTQIGTRALQTENLKFKIAENTGYDNREAKITFTSKDKTKTQEVKIYQAQKNAIVVSKREYAISDQETEIEIEVRTNVDFTVEGPDVAWLRKVETRALTSHTLRYTVDANTDYDPRTATIKITNKDNNLSETVTVTQMQKDAIVVAKSEYEFGVDGGALDFDVMTNVQLKVTIPESDQNWIKQVETRALEKKTLHFDISPCSEDDDRTGTITISGGNVTQTIKVAQSGMKEILEQERAALIALYNATDGDNWKNNTNWCSDKPISEWYGVSCRRYRVSDLHLSNNQLKGSIPPEIGSLTALNYLNLRLNQLTGSIPPEIGSLTALNHLDLSSNQLTGSIPPEIGSLTALNLLYLSNNQLTGSIPPEIGSLTALNYLNLRLNQLTGSIPPKIGSLTALNHLDLRLNQLTGSIPPEIGSLTALNHLDLSNNQLTGSIPPEIGNLTALNHLDLCFNQLTGSIPPEIGSLTALYHLSLSSNQLTGSIPPEIGSLTALNLLYLHDNQLTGTIPPEIGNLTALNHLELCFNQLTGSIPPEIGNSTALNALGLQVNQLTGTIPPEIGNLTALYHLSLSSNQLTGSIPAKIGNLTKLTTLDLRSNNLSGVIPPEVSGLNVWGASGVATVVTNPGLDIESAKAYVPEFTYMDGMNGKTINSTTMFGAKKYTALFYWAPWCGYSHAFIPDLVTIYKGYRQKDFDVIAFCANGDTQTAQAKQAIQQYGMNWWNILERGNAENVGAIGYPTTLIVDNTGLLKWSRIGAGGGPALEAFLKSKLGEPEEPEKPYESTDYSQDGKVTTLQTATEGNGIDIVLMGDAYSDRLIADGTYAETMRKAMEYFFTEEPYKTYRNLFNVYAVNAISKNEQYGTGMQTALEGYFGDGTHVGGNDYKCMDYALKIPGMTDNKLDETCIVVMMNRKYYAGTCWMYYLNSGDYGQGLSISYFPYLNDQDFAQVLHHETGGHGFPKLADEYAYQESGQIPQAEIDRRKQTEPYGWWKNADFTNDPAKIKWAKFISDPRYAAEALGVYEGAFTYWSGVWRPTENSIMRYNTGGFNAPSREAIYYRIHKLAYGSSWTYDYETFVAYDAKNRTGRAPILLRTPMAAPKDFVPLAPPVVVGERPRR